MSQCAITHCIAVKRCDKTVLDLHRPDVLPGQIQDNWSLVNFISESNPRVGASNCLKKRGWTFTHSLRWLLVSATWLHSAPSPNWCWVIWRSIPPTLRSEFKQTHRKWKLVLPRILSRSAMDSAEWKYTWNGEQDHRVQTKHVDCLRESPQVPCCDHIAAGSFVQRVMVHWPALGTFAWQILPESVRSTPKKIGRRYRQCSRPQCEGQFHSRCFFPIPKSFHNYLQQRWSQLIWIKINDLRFW
jgi:hypothetical protein